MSYARDRVAVPIRTKLLAILFNVFEEQGVQQPNVMQVIPFKEVETSCAEAKPGNNKNRTTTIIPILPKSTKPTFLMA